MQLRYPTHSFSDSYAVGYETNKKRMQVLEDVANALGYDTKDQYNTACQFYSRKVMIRIDELEIPEQ